MLMLPCVWFGNETSRGDGRGEGKREKKEREENG